jgi:hypothetical protein
MKITRKNNETKQLFETIHVGSCFIDGGCVFMKVEEIFDADDDCYNAIQLNLGSFTHFDPTSYVKSVNTELIVEE